MAYGFNPRIQTPSSIIPVEETRKFTECLIQTGMLRQIADVRTISAPSGQNSHGSKPLPSVMLQNNKKEK